MAETGHSATDATGNAGCPTCGRPWPPSAPPSLSAPVALAPTTRPPTPVPEQLEPRIVARTKREVAEIAGVATITVGGWIKAGKLPATGPWSDLQIAHASGISRGGSPRGALSEHGTTSRWRFSCRCDECRKAHNAETTRSRGPNVDWATVAPSSSRRWPVAVRTALPPKRQASPCMRLPGTANAIRSSPRRSILHSAPVAIPAWLTVPTEDGGRDAVARSAARTTTPRASTPPTRLLPQRASLVPGLRFRQPKCRLQIAARCEPPKDGRHERPALGIAHEAVGAEYFNARIRVVHRADELVGTSEAHVKQQSR